MEQEKLIQNIAAILHRLTIPYIITGGIAVVMWGRPRFTADIDVVIELTSAKIDLLAKKLSQIKGGFIDKDMMEEALKHEGEFNFIHSGSGLKVDFWILKNEAFDRERLKRKVKKRIFGQDIYFTSPEDLILIKLLWFKESGSTRHLEDIESILRIQKSIDSDYVKKWARRQDTLTMFNDLVKKKPTESLRNSWSH